MLVSTPERPETTTASKTLSRRKPPKPRACQKTILETKYSALQTITVRRYPMRSARTPQGISKARESSRETLSIRVI